MSDQPTVPTTADAFGKFRKELIEAGIPVDVVADVVRESLIAHVRDFGFEVKA